MTRPIPTLHVCVNRRLGGVGSCAAAGSEALVAALGAEIARRGLPWRVAANPCMAHCAVGPNLKAAPGGPLLHRCRAGDAAAIIDRLIADWSPS